jgi:hypothetical protein
MTIGGSIVLIVLGAIMYFAVELDIAGLDINVIGVILMAAGLIGLILGLVMNMRAGRTVERTTVDDREVY